MTFESFFKARLDRLFAGASPAPRRLLKDACFYSLFAPAGRFRPRLAAAAAESLGGGARQIFPWAAALEMAHCASLIHDDLPAMDNGRTRRGQKCAHLVFGEDMALLAGDCLFVEAFSLLLDPDLSLRRGELIRLFASKAGFHGLMGGQAMDLRAEKKAMAKKAALAKKSGKGPKPSVDFVLAMSRRKTGALIEAAVEGPLLLWGKTPAEKKALKKYGQALGLAYQMADDFIDRDSLLKSSRKTKALLKKFTEESLRALRPLKGRASALEALSLENQSRAAKAGGRAVNGPPQAGKSLKGGDWASP